MRRKFLFFIIAIYTGIINYPAFSFASQKDSDSAYQNLSLFGEVFERVREQYVTKPEDQKLIEDAISGMVTALDPHSSYMTPEEALEMMATTKGAFGGLGIEVSKIDDQIKIVSSLEDTPASKAGILSGDIIVKVDDQDIKGKSLSDVVQLMRGKIGTKVKLTILRGHEKKLHDFVITRKEIKVKEIRSHVDKDIGYIRLIQFSEQTYNGLVKAIKQIQKEVPDQKLKGYVLDLRLNPGGLLDQAVKVSSAFLTHGEIVSTKGRDVETNLRFNADGEDLTKGKPVIVLINGGTASAAEIVSGALQDHKRALILGTRSFGKGSVQTIIPLSNQGGLRLTTALYYTPSGKSIQGKGIVPDLKIIQPLPKKFQNLKVTLGESELSGHIKGQEEGNDGSGSSAYVPANEKEDLQLQKAYRLLRHQDTNKIFDEINKKITIKP